MTALTRFPEEIGHHDAPSPSDWSDLAEAALDPNVFAGPEMMAAAPGRIEPDDWIQVAVPRPGAGLDATVAIRITRALPVVGPRLADAFWSHYGPSGLPLLRAGVDDAADRLLAAVAEHETVLRLHYAALDSRTAEALRAAASRRGGGAFVADIHERAALSVTDGRDAALGPGLLGRRKRELDRQLRKLAGAGRLSLETLTDDRAVAGLDDFIALENQGWKGRVRSSLAADQRRVDFARALVASLAAAGRVRVDTLTLEDEPIGVLVTLFSGDTGFLWKIAYDERFAFGSPGVQLVRRATDAFLADPAIRLVDSLAVADHALMDRAWAGRVRMGALVLALDAASVGRAQRVAAIYEAERRLRAAARDLRGRVRERLRLAPGP